MKHISLKFHFIACCFILIFSQNLQSQNYLGYNVSNYAGIHGIFLQPASIADSRYKFDFNFVGLDFTAANNYYYVKWNAIEDYLRKGQDYVFNSDTSEQVYLFENLNGKAKYAYLNMDVQGPSFMVTITPRDAVGLFTRARSIMNIDDLDEPLAKSIREGFKDEDFWKKPLKDENVSLQFNAWTEYGLSYARVLLEENEHFVKAGINLKVLQGLGSAYLFVRNLDYRIHNEDTISIIKTEIRYGHTTNFNVKTDSVGNPKDLPELSYKFIANPSLGVDLGLVYEYRPNYERHKYNMDGKNNLWRKDENKYLFKIGISLLDWGKMKYTKDTNSGIFFADTTGMPFNAFDDVRSSQDLDSIFHRVFTVRTKGGDFKMNLPTALSFQIDWNIFKGLYLNFTPYFSLKSGGSDEDKNHIWSSYAITPRWEGQWLGIYMPINFSKIMGNDLGLALRLGPLIVGTRDLFGTWAGKSKIGDANFYMALRLPIPYTRIRDNDKDGVSNRKDRCPAMAGTWEFRGCPDTDGDHVPDSKDSCLEIAGLPEFGGCPDSDGDKVIDRQDSCPFLAGLSRFHGCPDTDNDTIPDYKDHCPNVPGDASNYGCPLKDTDKDGVPDKEDKCPNVAGIKANKGCPEIKKEEEDVLKLAFKNLEFETGNAIIKKSSYPSLTKLADLMKRHPTWFLSIAGHTDNVGGYEYNMNLSKNRAKAVGDYLIAKGVNPEMLKLYWYGYNYPVADNTTASGRQKNRRVEFKIFFEETETTEEKPVVQVQEQKKEEATQPVPEQFEQVKKGESASALYYVVVASFKNSDNARSAISTWTEKGIKVKAIYNTSNETYYITAGRFAFREDADDLKNKLKIEGTSSWVNYLEKIK